jgi:hypothetical protein
VGHEGGAAVALGVASATADAGAVEVLGDADPEDKPPQATMLASATNEISASRQEPSIQRFTRRCYSPDNE